MPTFDMVCTECGKEFEVLIPASLKKEQKCVCGAPAETKLSAPAGKVN